MSLTKKSGAPGPEKGAREAGLDSLTSTDLSECAGAEAEEVAGGPLKPSLEVSVHSVQQRG